ncbi:FAD/NAD(P)-binding protein [Geomobilimonas luticola]|uniref:FAD/NAD(P)-binding protein n=1 Tax=Geomobilimonas luticola TaxID=1114878 RepID=A0ABS5SGK3_9BACT|nr:FAD/NAD(P)-binding protein [Geomobilimonas luticola]MBT0654486.1 FAD/NAD(P)-binding protein [Geomobilimonas luticola]
MSAPELNSIPISARIQTIRRLTADTALFRLQLDGDRTFPFIPGQFVQLSVPGGGEVPISPADLPAVDGTIELCVRRFGHVTSLLHRSRTGDRVGIRGPFGNGFPVDAMAGKDVLLLAGGLGIAPLRSLLFHLLRHRSDIRSLTLMYGAREPAVMLFKDELLELATTGSLRLLLTVDFLSDTGQAEPACNVGLLPALLKGVQLEPGRSCAAVCGPPALYRCTIDELLLAGVAEDDIYLSLERRMKCGVGLCCHCAVGQLLCCCEGPVFSYRDIKNIPGAL